MNNEPVAYVSTTGLNDIEWTDASHSLNYGDALYTHPAELTDEEWLITYQTWALTSNDPLVLKQAILRKVQEK